MTEKKEKKSQIGQELSDGSDQKIAVFSSERYER